MPVGEADAPPPGPTLSFPSRLGVTVAVALGIAVLGGWLWRTTPTSAASKPAPGQQLSPLVLMLRAHESDRSVKVTRVPTEIPFIESPAAGRRDYVAGDFDSALAVFREEMAAHPGDAEPHSNAGQVLVRLGRTTEAVPLFERAVALDPARWAYRFNLARAHALLGEWDKAAQGYADADRLFPNDYATLFNMGQALHRAGREQEAVDRYRQAIGQKPDDSSFYLALGVSEEKLGHAAEAAAAYRKFASMEPAARQTTAVAERARQLEEKPAAPAGKPPVSPVGTLASAASQRNP